MTAYFILLFIASLLSYTSEKFNSFKSIKRLSIFLSAILLVTFAGIRDISVGADTAAYANRFAGNKLILNNLLNEESSLEFGYRILEWIAYLFSNNYASLLLLVSLFIVFLQLKTIYKISFAPTISIFVLITFGYYTFSFNGMRQGIALAIYLYALQYIINGNFKKYILYVAMAFFFHKTVIIMLPMYFVFRLKFSFRLLFILVISTAFAILFFDNLLDLSLFISKKYAIYKEMEATGGQLLTLSYLILSIFFITIRSVISSQLYKYYDMFLNMFIMGTIIYIVVQITGAYIEITRLAAYFLISIIFIWPIILKGIARDLKWIIFTFFVIGSLVFFTIYLTKIGNITPYKINEIFQ